MHLERRSQPEKTCRREAEGSGPLRGFVPPVCGDRSRPGTGDDELVRVRAGDCSFQGCTRRGALAEMKTSPCQSHAIWYVSSTVSFVSLSRPTMNCASVTMSASRTRASPTSFVSLSRPTMNCASVKRSALRTRASPTSFATGSRRPPGRTRRQAPRCSTSRPQRETTPSSHEQRHTEPVVAAEPPRERPASGAATRRCARPAATARCRCPRRHRGVE